VQKTECKRIPNGNKKGEYYSPLHMDSWFSKIIRGTVVLIMPDHIHGIIRIVATPPKPSNAASILPNPNAPAVGANNIRPDVVRPDVVRPNNTHPIGTAKTIGSMIRGFKTGVTQQLGYSIWQRNYHERIIRGDCDLVWFREYIRQNPIKWEEEHWN
jgi:REP element-mobilizing transposase RayT